jgi:hypothetical protein
MSSEYKATFFVFTHETLTPIVGKSTHATIKLLCSEIYANAAENKCALGGGSNGFRGIIMPNAEYLKIQTDMGIKTPVAFIKPAPPKVGDNAITIKRIEQLIVDCKAMESQLKKQVVAAIECEYIKALRAVKVGFARVPAKEII